MPDPTPPTEAERLREELENLAVAASPTMVWEQAFAVALDALLAAVRREAIEWAWDNPVTCDGTGEATESLNDYYKAFAAALRAGEGA